jgi:hypothetical protein
VLGAVLALSAIVALPANPAWANQANEECPPIPFEPTPECPGQWSPPTEEPSDGMWTPPAPVDVPMQMMPVANRPTDWCDFGVRPFQEIFATDTNQLAYTFEVDFDLCTDRVTGLITLFQHRAITPIPVDRRVVLNGEPRLLVNESTPPIAPGTQAPAGRFRYEVSVSFRPTPDSSIQTYVHRLGILVTTNPRQGRVLREFFRELP